MSENTVYKFCEKESECELLILEATPSQPESEHIPVVPRGGFHNSYYYVNNKKMPVWMNILFCLPLFFILILFGLIAASQGSCTKYPRQMSSFCEIGRLILKDNRRSVDSL